MAGRYAAVRSVSLPFRSLCGSLLRPFQDEQDLPALEVVGVEGGRPSASRAAQLQAFALHLVDAGEDRKSTRLNSSHPSISYAVFCLKKKKITSISQKSKKTTKNTTK